jgi:hypothetical protein
MMSVARTKRGKDKRLHEIEMKIAVLEGRQKELVRALEDPSAYEATGRFVSINRDLSAASPRSCPPDNGMKASPPR